MDVLPLLGSHREIDVVVVVVAAVAAALAAVALRERHRFGPTDPASGVDPRGRPFPSPPRALLTAPGTRAPEGAAARATLLRAERRASVLVLPVLAHPVARRPRWTELHDAVDSWLWHESWLRSVEPPPTTLPVDGLLIGTDLEVPRGRGRTASVPANEPLSVVGVAEGVILSRPAARTVRAFLARAARDAGVVAAEARRRPQAGIMLAHGLVGLPSTALAPAAAVLTGAPLTVLVAAALPTALGIVSAALRWSALVDLDRSTSLRFPGLAGVLLLVTGPAHAALTAVATWQAVPAPRPLPLRPGVGLDEAAA
ncbi:MAG: hypothetical protein ACFCVF_10905 [Kineosporiaceae bacterium]